MIAITIAATAAVLTWIAVSAALMGRCTRSLPVTEVPQIAALQAAAAARAEARAAGAVVPGPRTSPEDEPVMPALPVSPAVPAPRAPRR